MSLVIIIKKNGQYIYVKYLQQQHNLRQKNKTVTNVYILKDFFVAILLQHLTLRYYKLYRNV